MDNAQKLRKKLLETALQLFTEYSELNFELKFPWVLVYSLPRERTLKYSKIFIKPESKITLEGIVLRTWKAPYIKYFEETETHIYSKLAPGDHVIFQHYAGQPITREAQQEFKIIKEFSDSDLHVGDDCIFGKIQYEQKDVKERLADRLSTISMKPRSKGLTMLGNAQLIMNDFIVFPKEPKVE